MLAFPKSMVVVRDKKIIIFLLIFFILSSFIFLKKDLFSKLAFKLKKSIISLKGEFSVLAFQIPYFFIPHYPARLIYLVDELNYAVEELVNLNEDLEKKISKCSCENTQSQCRSLFPGLELDLIPGFECSPISVAFGDPCENRGEIEEKQTEIFEKTQEVNFLRDLLKTELESGMEEELKTLDEEERNEIKNNLDTLLTKSEKVITLAEENLRLPDDCSANNCKSLCLPGEITEFQACWGKKTEQKKIKFTLKFGVQLEDLDLGEVGIRNVNLNLPEEITISGFGKLAPFEISGREIILDINNLPQEIKLQVPKTPLPTKTPSLSFSCPGASSLSVCTYAIEAWKEPWCYCREGWRPLGYTRTGKPKGDRGGDCADFVFESPKTTVYGYTGNRTYGDWVYIAKDSCQEKGDREDGKGEGPKQILNNCHWKTSGSYFNPGERQEFECDLSKITGEVHAGVYRIVENIPTGGEALKEFEHGSWWHLCAKCDPKDPGYPNYGTPYNQCENKVK